MSHRTWIRSGLLLSIGLAGYLLGDIASSFDEQFEDQIVAVEAIEESQGLAQPHQDIATSSTDQQQNNRDAAPQNDSAQYQLFIPAQGINSANAASESYQHPSQQYNYGVPASNPLPPLPQQFGGVYEAQHNAPELNQPQQSFVTGAQPTTEKKAELKIDEEKDLSKYANAFKVPDRNTQSSISDLDEKLLNSASKPNGEMDAAAKRAQAGLEKAMQLAERGALHSARAEFLKALQISVQALDWQKRTNIHQQSLENGWKTIEELEDFYPGPGQSVTNIDQILSRHSSRAIASKDGKTTSLNQATTEYVEYASEQLSLAGGDFLPAADALFGLAKVYQIESSAKTENSALDSIRAETLYRACMKIEPRHAMAANELGVLLGKQGKLKDAKDILQLSASLSAHPSTWKNLAIVHQDLGEFQLAQLAQREGDLAEKRWQKQFLAPGQSTSGGIAVVDNTTFARSTPANIHTPSVPAQSVPNNSADSNQNRNIAQNPRTRASQQSAATRTADSSSSNPRTLRK